MNFNVELQNQRTNNQEKIYFAYLRIVLFYSHRFPFLMDHFSGSCQRMCFTKYKGKSERGRHVIQEDGNSIKGRVQGKSLSSRRAKLALCQAWQAKNCEVARWQRPQRMILKNENAIDKLSKRQDFIKNNFRVS